MSSDRRSRHGGIPGILTLSEWHVAQFIDPQELMVELKSGFAALARGEVRCPLRQGIDLPGKGCSLTMAAWRPGMQICVKVVNIFTGNLKLGLPNHLAVINLFDPDTGAATCVMDATYITAARTAATAVLSHRLLSRRESKIATIVGAGVQGREHLKMLVTIRDLDEIQICSREFGHAQRLAELHPKAHAMWNVEEAVRRSDLVCLCTDSPIPVIEACWIRPGTHVSSVGYCPPEGELPKQLAQQQRLFVETADAFLPPPAGCAELSGIDPSHATGLGDLVNDPTRGRRDANEITVYKAMGIAMEDMVAANLAYRNAQRAGGGSILNC